MRFLPVTSLAILTATAAVTLGACRRPLPLEMPPATTGAVPAPDLAEAKKFFGTWQCTQRIHRQMDIAGRRINLVATRSTDIRISRNQSLEVTVRTYSEDIDPQQEAMAAATAQNDQAAVETAQEYAPGLHSYTGQWSQQENAQGKKLWVMRQGPNDPPVGAYYHFGAADKEGKSKTLALTGIASQNMRMTGEVTGVFTRVR